MSVTFLAGLMITAAAYALTFLPDKWGIVGAIPRTFNAITGPLGGLFLLGMFVPRVRGRSALAATAAGLTGSIALGYLEQIGQFLVRHDVLAHVLPELSFTVIMPMSLAITLLTGVLLAPLDRSPQRPLDGLTWFTWQRSK